MQLFSIDATAALKHCDVSLSHLCIEAQILQWALSRSAFQYINLTFDEMQPVATASMTLAP